MATQTFVTTDMQAINTGIQVQQSSGQVGSQTTKTTSAQQATIIQSAHNSGQQFIVTSKHFISGDAGNEQVSEAVQQIQGTLQYQQQQSYGDYPSQVYTPVTGGTYYQPSGQMGIQGQLLTHQGGTYLVQGGAMDGEGHPLTHTTRASPATDANGQRAPHFDVKCWQREVQWLIDNYETAEGVSLPRSTLYNHYLRHCQEQKIDPMNPASFGRLIRSVFLGLRTRRLGTRGNSKYHYYGIRIKATSPLNQFTDDQTMAMRQQPLTPANAKSYFNRFKPSVNQGGGTESVDGSQGSQASEGNSQQAQHMQYLGDASLAIPTFEQIEMEPEELPEGLTEDHLRAFEELYKEHCEAILDIVVNLKFSLIEALWQSFWRTSPGDSAQNGEIEIEQRLSKDTLHAMCKLDAVQKYVRASDYSFYQALVEVLIPDVLRPIPSSLTQAIRNFAKSLEGWLKSAIVGMPDEMTKTKVSAVSAFAQTLRRYTSLNHLAQAARQVLQNTTQINQMLTDLNRVDFANVQEQASWVCQCDDSVVHQLEQDFKKTLQQQNSLEDWAIWLEGVVNQVLKPHDGSTDFPRAARQFLLKWSFYSSMVIRDLTLRSAGSFGSFHLIRLLYDEYMFYLVEHKVAAATGETPIAVMGEFIDLGSAMSLGTLENETKPVVSSVVTNTSSKLTAGANHTIVSLNSAMSGGHQTTKPTTVTVLAASSASQPTKTIVVVPVSATSAGGDAQPTAKRIKTQ